MRGQHRLIRRCLEFNHAQAMVGTTTGERFRVRRGLVQGCPLSPLLFNLFIIFLFAVQSPAGEETGTMTAYTEQPP